VTLGLVLREVAATSLGRRETTMLLQTMPLLPMMLLLRTMFLR